MTLKHRLLQAITDPSQEARIGVLEDFAATASFDELCTAARLLDAFSRDTSHNLYQRVRAIFQAYALYRYLIPARPELPRAGRIPHQGQELLLERHYAAATDAFLAHADVHGLSDPVASALAAAYHGLGFRILAEQVSTRCASHAATAGGSAPAMPLIIPCAFPKI